MNLGPRVRQLRQAKGWSLADLSKRCGVALSSLSRIETGRMTGTLESHIDVARALGVRVSELYATLDLQGPAVEIRPAAQVRERYAAAKGAAFAVLTESSLQKKMLPAFIRLAARKGTSPERGPAGSERFLYVLQGQMQLTAGDEKFRLGTGDSAYLQASAPHSLLNVGPGILLAISVTCPPVL